MIGNLNAIKGMEFVIVLFLICLAFYDKIRNARSLFW